MRRDGLRVVPWTGRSRARVRVSQLLPRGPTRFYVVAPTWWLLVDWVPREGLWAWKYGRGAFDPDRPLFIIERPEKYVLKKRQPIPESSAILPSLSTKTKTWEKFPTLVEFIAATAYADGTPRSPGYVTIRNRAITWEVTLYDPDSGSRLACSGPSLDDSLALAEKLLGAETAPWTRDNYLAALLEKKPKKKK